MLTIPNDVTLARALDGAVGPHIKRLLAFRRSQLGDGWPDAVAFLVAEDGDTIAEAEAAIGFPLVLDGEPTCDWTARHEGVTELCFVLSDDAPANVLLVPHDGGVGADLLSFADGQTDEACVPADHD